MSIFINTAHPLKKKVMLF